MREGDGKQGINKCWPYFCVTTLKHVNNLVILQYLVDNIIPCMKYQNHSKLVQVTLENSIITCTHTVHIVHVTTLYLCTVATNKTCC